MSITAGIGFVAPLLSVMFIFPQVERVFAKRSTEGLSTLSLLQGFSGSVLWTIYGIYKPNVQLALANFSTVVAIGLILAVCVKHKKIDWWLPILLLTTVSIAGVTVANFSMTMMGWLTIAIAAPAIIPQVLRVYRTEHLFGVSATMHGLLFICCATWFTYGVLINDWFVAIPNVVGVPGAFYIWVRAVKAHKMYLDPIEVFTS